MDPTRRQGKRVGFYVRKSIKAGPFRFNLSKSGLGISTVSTAGEI